MSLFDKLGVMRAFDGRGISMSPASPMDADALGDVLSEMESEGSLLSRDGDMVDYYAHAFGSFGLRGHIGNVDLRKMRHDIASDLACREKAKQSGFFKHCFNEDGSVKSWQEC